MVEASKYVIEKNCPKFKGRLGKIHPVPIVPEKPEYQLAQFELSFSGGKCITILMFAGGETILFPDPAKYHEEHIKIWNEMAPKPNRIYRDFEYRCYCSPLHEIIHCLQSLEHTKDATSWKSEHGIQDQLFNLIC